MKTLLLHNDNIPQSLLGNSEIEKALLPPFIYDFNYDTFVSKWLNELLKGKQYDCIILPYSLSNENYMEYTGLRVALHIRLTGEWNHSRVPILFVGPDPIEEVLKFSELGDVLVTPFVFTTKKTQVEDINKILEWINKNVPKMSDEQYKTFLNRINIQAPSNYATHHSIANEWAVMRWIDMFKWDNEKPQFTHDDFKNMLYFKYLLAKAGQRDKFKKDKKENPKIEFNKPSKDIKIVYIDDEYDKGWENILSEIFTISGIKKENFICYKEFSKEKSKQELITDIQSFIYKNDADCYLLDLRLHDDDFENKQDELSGLKIAQYIHDKNQGNQVVVFTASNKVWNLKKAKKYGVTDFVVKESPEFNCNRAESYRMYCEFDSAIKKAIKNSYKKDIVDKVSIIEKISNNKLKRYLSSFKGLLLLDDYELTIDPMMLILLNITEYYCKKYFEITSIGDLQQKESNVSIKKDVFKIKYIENNKSKTKQELTHTRFALSNDLLDVKFYKDSKACKDIDENYQYPLLSATRTIVICVLKYHCEFEKEIKNYLHYMAIRNTEIGHIDDKGTNNNISIDDVKYYFDVVYRLLNKVVNHDTH